MTTTKPRRSGAKGVHLLLAGIPAGGIPNAGVGPVRARQSEPVPLHAAIRLDPEALTGKTWRWRRNPGATALAGSLTFNTDGAFLVDLMFSEGVHQIGGAYTWDAEVLALVPRDTMRESRQWTAQRR